MKNIYKQRKFNQEFPRKKSLKDRNIIKNYNC